ncbi:hypothetical protein KTF36_17835 [Burkholderia gladioli]|uniref:hypothetical protein n=1 Tax=Burkholderia gladioli TaxID=28095 RepID=UPI001C2221EC|nr:hypothetical protein [Burkholderia gladioli]MBU9643713.1 hypothetical protein [Burkholderia gladioli]
MRNACYDVELNTLGIAMAEHFFHANFWTVCVDPVDKGEGVWAAQWSAVRAGPHLVGQQPREPERCSSGEIRLCSTAAEAAAIAHSAWRALHDPELRPNGAQFAESRTFDDWEIVIEVSVSKMSHQQTWWKYSYTATSSEHVAKEAFDSQDEVFPTASDAFAAVDRELIKKYRNRR